MIRLTDVSKWYNTKSGRHYVLRDQTLEIPSGQSVAIVGRNGAGKSTLVRILGGIEYVNRGSVEVFGTISWPLALTTTFQISLTGRQNVRCVARINGVADEDLRDIEDFVEDFAELGKFFDLPVRTYSTGMITRLGFALSMAFPFDYYLIDEAMEVGDARFREKSYALLKDRLSRSKTVMVSHEEGRLKQYCNVAIVLWAGAIHYFPAVETAFEFYRDRLASLDRAKAA